ncbi:iron-sulfur cluster repair protein YtfE (RIC family) [Thalassobacillus devorans]|nr:hemerythrin domain-containing protein [Thalassobacillus devorans]NIK27599.1 iron-sulfur cluster repair protein YtfE (RIC family) [Thalassobacillus devorans]
MSHECAGMKIDSGATQLCAALQHLKDEHPKLEEMMKKLQLAAAETKETPAEEITNLLALREEVISFMEYLIPHSEKEEGVLFPMMGKYIGTSTGPLVVMEYEHDLAKESFESFLKGTKNVTEIKDPSRLHLHVLEGCTTLFSHFNKEENVLFPMGENVLTDEDKEKLADAFQIPPLT